MLQEKMRTFARETGALPRGETVVVGVSGGVDSVALLHALRAVAPELGLRLHVAHLNHGLRGESADADAAFVAGLARDWGLPATLERVDVAALASREALSLEAAAREARYAFFAEVVGRQEAPVVVVGHTADDQVETVLLHFLRGSGLAGLRGMVPVQTLRVRVREHTVPLYVARPLLDVSRGEVERYAAEHGLTYRQDETNADPAYTRNRIRHELLPLLEQYNPGVRRGIARMARVLADDFRCLADLAESEWARSVKPTSEGVALPLSSLRDSPVAVARLLVRSAYNAVAGTLADLTAEHTDQVLSLAKVGRTGARLDLPGGPVVLRAYGELRFAWATGLAEALPEAEAPLQVPGMSRFGAWEARAEVRGEPCRRASGDLQHADFDLDRLASALAVRRRRPGDRLRPPGLNGTKKLQDIMVDAKVPRDERDNVPVVTAAGRVIWAVGLAADERVLSDVATRKHLCLQFHKKGAT